MATGSDVIILVEDRPEHQAAFFLTTTPKVRQSTRKRLFIRK